MVNSNAKGDRRERGLVNFLYGDGFAVMRAPASGSATERELPDVLAGNGDVFYAIEGKASAGDPIYVYKQEVEDLLFFADGFGANPLIGTRWDEEPDDPSYGEDWPGWYFHHPENLHRTPDGHYRVKKEDSMDNGIPITQL